MNEFRGMTSAETSLAALEQTQHDLITQLPRRLTPVHRAFLLSLVLAEPNWELMPFKHLHELPAMKWKLLNLQKLRSSNPARFAQQQHELQARWHALDERTG